MDQKIFVQWKTEFDAKNLSKAVEILEAENKNNPGDLQCLYHLGFTYRGLGDFEKAEHFYLEALKIDPGDGSVNLGLGVVYQQSGNFDKAIKYLKRASAFPQSRVNAFNSLGLTYKKKGDVDKAIEAYLLGIKSLFREICEALSRMQQEKMIDLLENTNGSALMKPDELTMWFEFAATAVKNKSMSEGINTITIPTPKTVARILSEDKNNVFWNVDADHKTWEILPLYFDTVRERLSSDLMYSILNNNLAVIASEVGHMEAAKKGFEESIMFIPEGVDYPNPFFGLKELAK